MDITGKIKLTIRNVIPENSQEMPLNFPLEKKCSIRLVVCVQYKPVLGALYIKFPLITGIVCRIPLIGYTTL